MGEGCFRAGEVFGGGFFVVLCGKGLGEAEEGPADAGILCKVFAIELFGGGGVAEFQQAGGGEMAGGQWPVFRFPIS